MAEKLTGQLEMLEEEEERITELGGLQLTNKRLAHTGKVARGSVTSAAMIGDVDSATMQKRRASPALIVIGVILVIIGIAMSEQYYTREYSWVPVLVGVIMVGLFFLLRKRIAQFTIAGMDWLSISTRKLGSQEKIAEFVNKFFELKDRLSKG
ncbi:hypothetical protein ES702_05700 [subsurface metagenome]